MKTKLLDLAYVGGVVLFAALYRLLPHPANFVPISALALFGGAHLNKRYALVVPLAAMIFSDLFLGFSGITIWVYASFLLIGLIGLSLRRHLTVTKLAASTLASSLLFFGITNFGVWLTTTLYSKDLMGLVTCFIAALPFFRNTLLSDALFTGLFFGGYALLNQRSNQFKEWCVRLFTRVRDSLA